jgi:polyphosphate kinase
VSGLSDNIRVRSVVGRFLEHSRIFYFFNNGNEEIFLGSADLMPRNLDHRVEIMFPISDRHWMRLLRDEILELYLKDNTAAREMKPDGTYNRLSPGSDVVSVSSQTQLLSQRSRSTKP